MSSKLPFSLHYPLPYHSWHFPVILIMLSEPDGPDMTITSLLLIKVQHDYLFCDVNFIGVFRILFDLCSCSFKYFSCWRVNIVKTLVIVKWLFFGLHMTGPIGKSSQYRRVSVQIHVVRSGAKSPGESASQTLSLTESTIKKDGVILRGAPCAAFQCLLSIE